MDDELRFHVEMQIEDNLRLGMNPAEARYDAMRRFGGIESVKEQYRDRRSFAAIEALFRDIHYAARALRKSPGFTTVAVITLALGTGINATVFTVTNAVLFKGPPFIRGNDRLVYLGMNHGCCVSWPDLEDWRTQARTFEGIAGVNGLWMSLRDKSGRLDKVGGIQVSTNIFRLLGQKPFIGRDFLPSDETRGAAPVAILTYEFWNRRYGKDPAVIGQTVTIDGAPTTLIGVMPRGFSFPWMEDLWVPFTPQPNISRRENRGAVWFAIGRIADGATIGSARAEMESIGRRLARDWPLTNEGFLPRVLNRRDFMMGSNATEIYGSLWGAVAFVLLIACANLANLQLARAIGRSREISVRLALGAGRWRIVRQLLIESLMLSGLGGAIGWWMARAGVHAYSRIAVPEWKQSWFDFTMDYRVMGYLLAVSIGTGLLFGLAPAVSLLKFDVNAALKDGGRSATGGSRGRRLSAILVTGEMALATVLLAGAGVMARSFLRIYTAKVGVQAANVLDAYVQLPEARYPGAEARISFYESLRSHLEALPAVVSVAMASSLPTGGSLRFACEVEGAQGHPTLSALIVSPAYFRTLGAPVLSGREFNDADGVSGVPAVIVNQRLASTYWRGENPLGKRLRPVGEKTPEVWLNVVGVAPDIVQNDRTRQERDALIYLPYRQRPERGMYVMAQTRVPPANLSVPLWREIQRIEPNLPVGGPDTLTEVLNNGYRDNGINGTLFLIFAAVALLLASVGLYGVMAHSVGRRTQEIGIRMALGATASHTLRLVFRQGALPLGIGLTVGLLSSFAVNRFLQSQLVQVSPSDPVTLAAASATLILASLVGCWIPARRAMRVDPVVALRYE